MPNIEISPEVLDVLKRSTITENVLVLPPGQLERPLYEAVNKVIKNAGGKWTRGKGHVFEHDPREKLGLAMQTGVSIDQKKAFQAFYTPPEVAKRVVELARVKGKLVLEPSAGEGALVTACYAAGCAGVTAVELNPETAVTLGSKLAESEVASSNIYVGDFMEIRLKAGDFDRVVMNPPFTKNQDIKHVARALTFLARGGILVAVMADNTSRSGFSDLLFGHDYDIERLPAGTFKESGTNVRTLILTIRKP